MSSPPARPLKQVACNRRIQCEGEWEQFACDTLQLALIVYSPEVNGAESLPDDPPADWIGITEARRITRLSRQQINNLIDNKKFRAIKNVAGHWRLDPDPVKAYAPGAWQRKVKRGSRDGQHDPNEPGLDSSARHQEDDTDPLMQELARLRARVRMLEDELVYERQAAENRWASQDAQEEADKLLEKALLASRKARESQAKEIKALEERIGYLRGPSHPGDLFDS
jgi:hypothetical protein